MGDFLEQRMMMKRAMFMPQPMAQPVMQIPQVIQTPALIQQPTVQVLEPVPSKTEKKAKFVIPNDPDAIVDCVIDKRPNNGDVRKAMAKYIAIVGGHD